MACPILPRCHCPRLWLPFKRPKSTRQQFRKRAQEVYGAQFKQLYYTKYKILTTKLPSGKRCQLWRKRKPFISRTWGYLNWSGRSSYQLPGCLSVIKYSITEKSRTHYSSTVVVFSVSMATLGMSQIDISRGLWYRWGLF